MVSPAMGMLSHFVPNCSSRRRYATNDVAKESWAPDTTLSLYLFISSPPRKIPTATAGRFSTPKITRGGLQYILKYEVKRSLSICNVRYWVPLSLWAQVLYRWENTRERHQVLQNNRVPEVHWRFDPYLREHYCLVILYLSCTLWPCFLIS